MTSSEEQYDDRSPDATGETSAETSGDTGTGASAEQGAPAPAGEPQGGPAQGEAAQGESGDGGEQDVVPGGQPDGEPSLEEQLAERTSDLQRLSAEYANYRKRVERDRQLIGENATFKALTPIIEVLDTIDRAKEHGELEGGFKSVADLLARAVESQGLLRFGQPGEEFDPNVHDALTHLGADPEVTVTTIKHVAKAGYRIGDRVVRAAQVVVVDPVDDVG